MTNNKQQTAVEWYRIKISSLTSDLFKEKISGEQFRNLEKEAYEQAKEMEKEIIIDAIITCEKEHYVHSKVYPPQFVINKAEQYYNNKYENEKQ
jgi:adenylate kinase